MNKAIKIISLITISIFGGFFFSLTFAQVDELVVEFEKTPLFEEKNFLPGEGLQRWVKVINNSNQTQRIAVEAINVDDPNNFGTVLNLEIKEGGATLYNNALSQFFRAGEVYLSNLPGGGGQTQYDFIVTFYPGAGNLFQGKTLKFDLLIGFQGTEGGILPGAGSGAGGFLPPGLTIKEESLRTTEIGETSVTIVWTTSYLSTSQVIYDTKPGQFNLAEGSPNYGYAFTKIGDDSGLEKVTSHSVTLTNLTPGTTYYYRTVSHGSLAISREYSFTTLGKKSEEKIPGEEIPKMMPAEKEKVAEEVMPPKREEIAEEVERPKIEEITPPEEIIPSLVEKPKEDFGPTLLASLADSWQSLQKGKIFTNPIFWVFLASLGFLLSGLSLINKPRILFGFLGFFGIFSILISSLFLPLPLVEQLRMPVPDFISYPIGGLLFLAGILIIILATKSISFKVASNMAKPKELITSGIYQLVRHPFYFGFSLVYLGWSIFFKSILAILFLPLVFLFFFILIIFEERDLLKTYGYLYQEYKQKVPSKIIPKIL